MTAFVADLATSHEASTIERYKSAFALFAQFLDEMHEGVVLVDALSEDMLKAFYAWLESGKRTTKARGTRTYKRSLYTRKRLVEKVEAAWKWLDERTWHPSVPRARTIEMRKPVIGPVDAPTFAEMAACVNACLSEGPRKLTTILYYLGLRTMQALDLPWSAIDVDRGTATIPPHKGLPGRIIPLPAAFVAEVKGWGTREGTVCGWHVTHQRAERALNEAWARAGVREAAWKRAPGKAFRRGLTTGLKRLRVDREDAELFVGRVVEGARRHYLDVGALPLEHVAAAIPPISSHNVVAFAAKKRG